MLPFKAFSAYANYPFTLDTASDETSSSSSDDDVAAMMMDVVVPPTPDALSTKAHRTALTSHEREVRLLELERSFAVNFANHYKDLPALVHTYGFALQCLVNVGVRGSESIRTRVVEAGVLGVVARILGGFLDYRTQERDKRVRMLVAAHDEKEKETQSSSTSSSDKEASSALAKAERRERHSSSRMTSGESDTTAVLSMSTRRERRDRERGERGERSERDRERDATQALALANAQVQLAAINQQFQSQRQQQYALQQQHLFGGVNPPTTNNNAGISLVAGMPAPAPVNANISNAVSTTPRQTRSAAVQALLNSGTEIPTLANPPRQYTSSIVPPISMRSSPPRRRSSGSSTPSSVLTHPMNPSSSSMPSSTNLTTSSVAAVNSLIAAEHIMISSNINRTNTPDTIASIDEVQEFSDVNQDEIESTTSSGHENEEALPGNAAGGVMMDVIDASSLTEVEAQSTSAMMIASTVLSNPASRSVSRNRINANVLAQHRPVPPPSSMLRDEHQQHQPQDTFISAVQPVIPQNNDNDDNMNVQAPTMLGDVTIKLEHMPTTSSSSNEAMDDGADSDVVMERDNDREDHESTDDTGTSASPVSRPHSSQHSSRHHHHHHHHYLQHAPRYSASSHRLQQQQQVPFLPRSGSASSFDSNAATTPAGAAAAISGSAAVSSGGMQMDSETTPVSRPIPLRRASSSAAMAAATPRNAYTTAATASLHVPAVPSQPTSSTVSSSMDTARSSTSTTRPPHTSTHVHLRLRPELQQSASTNPSVVRDGSVHLLLNYGPLMDHYIKEEDVLHCLHLLAYLSKYPHVRAVFHDPENEICRPPSASTSSEEANNTSTRDASMVSNSLQQNEAGNRGNCCSCARKKLKFGEEGVPVSDNGGAATSSSASAASLSGAEDSAPAASAASSTSAGSACHGHCHAHAEQAGEPRANTHSRSTSSGSQKHGHPCCANEEDEEAESLARARAMATMPAKDRKPALEPSRPPRSTANNVFSLVERYTFRPSSPADRSMRLGTDIQYWAGVIMRNACRKDELRGGIRQCANMGCGVWERFPREFAKCRRCRKAKYCSKGCQRRAWQAGHR